MTLKKNLPLLLAGLMFLYSSTIVMANANDEHTSDTRTNQHNENNLFSASGPMTFFNFDGRTFMHHPYISINNGVLKAQASVYTRDFRTYPGRLTVNVDLYNSYGSQLGAMSETVTNNIGAVAQTYDIKYPGEYRASGYTLIQSPRGSVKRVDMQYTPWITFNPNLLNSIDTQDFYTVDLEYLLLEALKTDGMLKAITPDGTSGYVYAKDILGDVNNTTNELRTIRLYDEDGVTVITEFQIY